MTSRYVTWIGLFCLLIVALAAGLPGPATGSTGAAGPAALQLAIVEAQAAIPLDDIVSGRARLGFNPLAERGLHVIGKPGSAVWLRLRMQLPEDGQSRFISLPRQAIDHLRLYQSGPPDLLLAESGIGRVTDHARWPDAFVLALPAQASGAMTVYLQVQGRGHLNLQPRLISAEQVEVQVAASGRLYAILYGGLFMVGVLAMIRRWVTGERTLHVAAAAFSCLCASIVGNYHLQLTVGGTSLASLPALPAALWVLACAPVFWATQQYAGHDKNFPSLAVMLDRTGFIFLAVGVGFLFVPPQYIAQAQVASLGLLAITAVICGFSLVFDPRQWRWGPILIWLGVIPALLAIVLSMLQLIPSSILVRRGFQVLLGLQLAAYLLLPWLRQTLQKREKLKRSLVVRQSAEEKIAHAREMMMSGLQAGILNAIDGDLQWIAFRRLMAGLRPVLPQSAAAIIAVNYHNEDLLLVEPKAAEVRFQMLLAQRGSLLKNLSRSLAPQQIGLDFDGPEGPLRQVLLAIIPLPIDRPGWGVLVIERSAEASYSEEELDLCTEFAALATTAGDEAALVMQARQANEIDAESGVYRRGLIEQTLAKAFAQAAQGRRPFAVLRVCLDGFDLFDPGAKALALRKVADVIREEIDYGESIGRFAADEFIVLLSGRSLGEAQALAERVCASMRKQAIATGQASSLTTSIGAAHAQPGERTAQMMLERAERALAKARQYGGDQVQAVASANV